MRLQLLLNMSSVLLTGVFLAAVVFGSLLSNLTLENMVAKLEIAPTSGEIRRKASFGIMCGRSAASINDEVPVP